MKIKLKYVGEDAPFYISWEDEIKYVWEEYIYLLWRDVREDIYFLLLYLFFSDEI